MYHLDVSLLVTFNIKLPLSKKVRCIGHLLGHMGKPKQSLI
jgi:hypothetical protein